MRKTAFLLATALAVLSPAVSYALTAQWVSGTASISVVNPSQATGYFGVLTGQPQVFVVSSSEPLKLYVTAMQPDVAVAKQDLSIAVLDPHNPDIPLGVILGPAASWTPTTYEGGAYHKAPDFRATLPAGEYHIQLWSSNNDAPYVVVIGEHEAPLYTRFVSALSALPTIDHIFYGKSGVHILLAPIVFWPLFGLVILVAVAIWLLARRRAPFSLSE